MIERQVLTTTGTIKLVIANIRLERYNQHFMYFCVNYAYRLPLFGQVWNSGPRSHSRRDFKHRRN